MKNLIQWFKFEIHSIRRDLERLWCKITTHQWKRGENGWENFGTGIYCTKCSKMYNDPFVGK
jgi:hypothetical protein